MAQDTWIDEGLLDQLIEENGIETLDHNGSGSNGKALSFTSVDDLDELSSLNPSALNGSGHKPEEIAVEEEAEPKSPVGDEEEVQIGSNSTRAIKSLSDARNRAGEVGLIPKRSRKLFKSVATDSENRLWPSFPPKKDEAGKNGSEPERPMKMKDRIVSFVEKSSQEEDVEILSITDESGYSLIDQSTEGSSTFTSYSKVIDQVNRLNRAVGAPACGSTQVALADDRWLCMLEAAGANGEVVVQLQSSDPVPSEKAERIRAGLEAALAG